MDSGTTQVNANLSSRKKVKKNKHKKSGQGVLDKSETDQRLPQEVESVSVESSSVEKKDGGANDDVFDENLKDKSVAQEVVAVSNKKKQKRKRQELGNDAVDKSGKDQDFPYEVVVVKPDPCLPTSDDFVGKIDTEIVESSSSNKGKTKRKKHIKGKNVHDIIDKVQELPEKVAILQPKVDPCSQSLASKIGKLDDEAVGVKSVLQVSELGSRKESSLIPKKMDTESGQVDAEISSLKESKVKRRKKKQKKGNNAVDRSDKDKEMAIDQPENDLFLQSLVSKCLKPEDTIESCIQEASCLESISEVAVLDSRKDNSMLEKQNVPLENENPLEVKAVQPNRDPYQPSSNDFLEKIDTESEQVKVEPSSSNNSTVKRKSKKKKKRDDVQDPQEERVIVQTEKDVQLQSLVVQPVSEVAELASRRDSSLIGKQSDSVKNENALGLEAVQSNRDLSIHDFIKKMDTEIEVANAVVTSSSKKKKTRKKLKRGDDVVDMSAKDQEEVVIVQQKTRMESSLLTAISEVEAEQPKRDLCPQTLNEFNKEMDTESNQGNEELSSSNKRKKKKKKQKTVDNLLVKSDKDQDLEEQVVIVQPKSDLLSTSEIEAVQPKRDQCPLSSNDLSTKVDAGSDHVTAELSSSKKKGKKLKRQNDGKSDKDHLPEVVIVQPKSDLLFPSPEVSSLKSENTLEGEVLQPKKDLCPASSTDFKKVDKGSGQVNAELCSSSKRKRKREKQKKGDNILGKSYKDHDLAEEVIVKPKVEVAELGSKKDSSLMPDKQSGALKDGSTLDVEAVQQNGHLCPPSSNGSIKEMKTDSDQVNAELSPPNKRKRKRKKQKEENNVPDNIDKVQDLAEEVRGSIQDMAEVGVGLKSESKIDKITMAPSTKKLLILDINGLLADIVSYGGNLAHKPDTIISRKAVFKRPFCDDFLQFCFERFNVAVWSSRTRANVDTAVRFLMRDYRHKLVFCWDQSHCTHTKFYTLENNEKPLVLKELKYVWEKGEYNESNTLLVDDSPYKALRNPAYTAIFPQPYSHTDANDASLGPGGDLRVYLEGLSKADNTQKYVEENSIGQERITDTHQHWHFYSKILQI